MLVRYQAALRPEIVAKLQKSMGGSSAQENFPSCQYSKPGL
jgi:hypothetical protein